MGIQWNYAKSQLKGTSTTKLLWNLKLTFRIDKVFSYLFEKYVKINVERIVNSGIICVDDNKYLLTE